MTHSTKSEKLVAVNDSRRHDMPQLPRRMRREIAAEAKSRGLTSRERKAAVLAAAYAHETSVARESDRWWAALAVEIASMNTARRLALYAGADDRMDPEDEAQWHTEWAA